MFRLMDRARHPRRDRRLVAVPRTPLRSAGAMTTPAAQSAPRLSICIATFKRGAFIGETLASFLPTLPDGVEVIVLDGASPDNTADVVSEWSSRHPQLRYIREDTNSGVDQDYDKAVGYARGDYCWLMTDDDLLRPGAVASVLAACADDPDLVVVNSAVEDTGFERVLAPRLLDFASDRDFDRAGEGELFALTGKYLSFIGAVVIRRALWMARAREPYYGSLFIHFGVDVPGAGDSQRTRAFPNRSSGCATATRCGGPRGFDIWMRMWPELVWSFGAFPTSSGRGSAGATPGSRRARSSCTGTRGLWHGSLPAALLPPSSGPTTAPARDRDGSGQARQPAGEPVLPRRRGPGRMSLHDLLRSVNSNGGTRLVARLAGA
jgi:hypothetical protein